VNQPKSEVWAERAITLFGSGYAPFASGSWGSLVAVILFVIPAVIIRQLPSSLAWMTEAVGLVPGIVISVLLSIWWGDWALEKFGNKDPKPFVLDEFAGQWISLVSLPIAAAGGSLTAFAVVVFGQFFFFRLFDVIKPPPAAQLESLPSGWGVLCDDLMAGVYANIAGQILWRFTPVASLIGLTQAGA